ncbi:hypothetical protein STA3757_08900 [Stanieria sp. NIES-3757]|nr:hypothetical protein STA3757_08900 [Stanieria sp. NIES-3757]
MGKSKRLNRDDAKKTQRPMVEDRVIVEHLTALLTPTITSGSRFFREYRISLEMIYRGLDYFLGASKRGEAHDPVKYFAHSDIRKC